jgi:hypothetical protein
MIQSILDKSAGFYSLFFFTLNHYLYAKKNNISFEVNGDNWLFKYKNGWEDYFQNINFYTNNDNGIIYSFKHYQTIHDYPLLDYKYAIKETYKYNDETMQQINTIKKKIQLLEKDYDAIFIRRGDKLTSESNFISADRYIECLLTKNPDCKTIFLQTDDYNCYIELQTYITNQKLDIQLITLCNEYLKGGMIIFDFNLQNGIEQAVHTHTINKDYIHSVIDSLRQVKPVNQMSPDEIYQHTIDMIIGVDIVLNSNICICEYSSNVSKFIKLAHNNSNNVYDILHPNEDVDMNRTECPAFGFLR